LPPLAHYRKSLRQQVIQRFALLYPLFELRSFVLQLLIRQRSDASLKRVDGFYGVAILFKQAVITATEYTFQQFGNHVLFLTL